jgi:putative membrane protein
MDMMWYSHDGGWWWLMVVTSSIVCLALVSGVIALVVWAVRTPERSEPTQQSSARAILEERFARGEIGVDEFQQRLRLLGGGRHP